MLKKHLTLRSLTFMCVALSMLASCTSTKNLEYFQDLPNSTVVKLDPLPQDQRVIESGDEINIVFIARDDAAAAYFNKAAVTNTVSNDGINAPKSLSNSMGAGLN
jgi:polysaccharide biosynthesis/export protein